MIVGVCKIELFLPQSRSLKAKRQVLKSLKDRIRNRFNVSIAEVDHQDLWQRGTLALAIVSGEKKYVNRMMQQILAIVYSEPRLQLLNHSFDWY
tara:strand:+ start:7226 stop:7507 length:282 start_codon:yes stop_codon:yes gene_type:complete